MVPITVDGVEEDSMMIEASEWEVRKQPGYMLPSITKITGLITEFLWPGSQADVV